MVRKNQVANLPLLVTIPDGSSIQSPPTELLNFPGLPEEACLVHMFTAIVCNSLILIIQLTKAGFKELFDNTSFTISKDSVIIITGSKEPKGTLWTHDLKKLQ